MKTMNLKTLFLALMISMTPFLFSCNDEAEDEGMDEDMEQMEDGMEEGMGAIDMEDSEPMMDVTVYSDVDPAVQGKVDALVDPYLQMKNAFVATDAVAAKQHAQHLQQEVQNMKIEGLPEEQQIFMDEQLTAIQQHAGTIAASSDVNAQREAFYPLSESMYKVVKAFGANDEMLYVQYCPMAFNNEGAWWISDKEEIRNPYFGDKMLKCGSVREKIAQK